MQIDPEVTNVFVSPTGEVSVETADGTQIIGQLELVRFPNPAGMKAQGGNLYTETEASGPPEIGAPGENGFGVLQQGYLEMSNVNVVEEMVNMIIAQRAYEINSKSIQTSDDMLSRVNQLKRAMSVLRKYLLLIYLFCCVLRCFSFSGAYFSTS